MKPNADQQRIIDDFENDILLFASAGTGKTFTVANKIKKAIESGFCSADEILALTFTKKAAEEMLADVKKYCSNEIITVDTIHGFCLRILREAAKLGYSGYVAPTVKDEVDAAELIRSSVMVRLDECIADYAVSKAVGVSLSEYLNKKKVVYSKSLGGFFWVDEKRGLLVGSYGKLVNLSDYLCGEFTDDDKVFKCPECGKSQSLAIGGGLTCPNCGFMLSGYVQPYAFSKKNHLGWISLLKHRRALSSSLLSLDDETAYQEEYNLIKANAPDTYKLFVSEGFGKNEQLDERFSRVLDRYAGKIVRMYNEELRQRDALDYDDLIIETYKLLGGENGGKFQKRYKLIVVDEMQDTSLLEYKTLSRLFGSRVMFCGDFFQTIYEWRGSKPEQILDLYNTERKPKTYMLSENYRATKILSMAGLGYLDSAFGAFVNTYLPNNFSVNSEDKGDPIVVIECQNIDSEAEAIYSEIVNNKYSASDVCIAARTNYDVGELYDALTRISQKDGNKLSFFAVEKDFQLFKKPPVKDLLCYLSLLINSTDVFSIERLAEKYVLGVGKGTIKTIHEYAKYGADITAYLNADSYRVGDAYASLIECAESGDVVVYDLETTGLDRAFDEAIQLAAVRINAEGEVIGKFEKFIVPKREISAEAERVHGYSLEIIKSLGGVTAKAALTEFSEFCRGSVLVGHNSAEFDSVILKRQLKSEGLPRLDIRGEYDTLIISRCFLPELNKYTLERLSDYFGIVNERAHDAFSDVLATKNLLVELLKRHIVPETMIRVSLLTKYVKPFKPFYDRFVQLKKACATKSCEELIRFVLIDLGVAEKNGVEDVSDLVFDILQSVNADSEVLNERLIPKLLDDSKLSGSRMSILIKRLNRIPILTVHQTKGCEFSAVFIAEANSDKFPSFAAVKSGNETEELRVFYVAMSRAKKRLYITYVKEGTNKSGYRKAKFPSPYIAMIPREYVKLIK